MDKLRLRIVCLLLAFIVMSAMFMSCNGSGKETTTTTGTQAATTTKKSTEGTAGTTAGMKETEPFDPMAKYEEPVELTTVIIEDSSFKYKDGDDINNNVWTRYLKDEFGINFKHKWTVGTTDAWNSKMAVALFSNDLPDFFPLYDAAQYEGAVKSGIAMDITDLYEKYASDKLKELLTADGGITMDRVTRNGRLYCLPLPSSATSYASLLFIRKDYLEATGLGEPKSIDDFVELMRIFTEEDPDGNNVNDTYGLALNKDIYGGSFTLRGFFEGFGSYVKNGLFWIEKDGKLECSAIQPETREALEAAADLYAKGYLDPEFGTKDTTILRTESNAGRYPMQYGSYSAPGFYKSLVEENLSQGKDLDVIACAPPSKDGGMAVAGIEGGVTYFVVNSKCEHPEAFMKLANASIAVQHANGDEEGLKIYKELYIGDDGFQYFKFVPYRVGSPNLVIDRYEEAMAVVDGRKKLEEITVEYANTAVNIMNYEIGNYNYADWLQAMVFGRKSSGQVLKEMFNNDKMIYNAFYGSATDSMVKYQAVLMTLQLETFMQVITGHEDISKFDEFVADWKKLGGDAITQEVNDWYNSIK